MRLQTHGHALVPQVDIGVMVRGVGKPADASTSATSAAKMAGHASA